MTTQNVKFCRVKWFAILLVFLAPGFACPATPRTLSNITYDEDYDIFYQQQFHNLMARAKKAIPRAYESVIKQWGLPDEGGLRHPLTVQVKEISSDTLRRWEAAYVQAQGTGDNLRQTLVIDIGCYMQNPEEDIENILRHEMAHVILGDFEAGSQAASIPPWLNEGLAQSVTLEGFDRVQEDIMELHHTGNTFLLCDLDGPVDEFAHGPFNASCYPEYYLAVQRLKQLGGPQTFTKILQGLREGEKVPDLMQSVAGMDWPDFKKEAERYASDVLTGSKSIP